MGYTNYWYISETFNDEEWNKITTVAKALVDDPSITGWDGKSSTLPVVNEHTVTFNGLDESNQIGRDNSHETFSLVRDVKEYAKDTEHHVSIDPTYGYFFFCKTARKPYDEHVWKMLCAARNAAPTKIKISNDDSTEMFMEA
tara:strand:- start:705 stop:1130 length:426 start_codon:yes stop_codon:yes gene_type:complete